MRKVLFGWVILVLLFAGRWTYAEGLKVVFIDAQKILENSKEGKRVKTTVEEYVKSRQKIIDLEEEELKQLEEDLNRQASVLSPEAKKVKQDTFQKKLVEYQKKATDLNKEVQGKKLETLKEFNKRLEEAVKQVADKEGYSFVLDRGSDGGAVVYAKETFDITPKVIEQVDKVSTK